MPSRALPGQIGVHPFHPSGLNRLGDGGDRRSSPRSKVLIDWSRAHAEPTLSARRDELAATFARVREAVEKHLASKIV